MNENMNMENSQIKQNSIKWIMIALIGLVVILTGYILYDKYISKDEPKSTQTTTTDTTKVNNPTKEEVPIKDKTAFIISATQKGGRYVYCYIEDGSLYYYGNNISGDNGNFELMGASYSNDIDSPKKYEELDNIKRIKVLNKSNYFNPKLYAITEDGKVYYTDGLAGIKFEQVDDLKNYQVDDLLDYNSEDTGYCYYKFILKDGTTKEITVNY